MEEEFYKTPTLTEKDLSNLSWALKFLQDYERKHHAKKTMVPAVSPSILGSVFSVHGDLSTLSRGA